MSSTATASSTSTLSAPSAAADWHAFSEAAPASEAAGQALWDSRMRVSGMHCAACAGTVTRLLTQVPGVVDAQVNAATGRALVRWQEGRTSPNAWMDAVERGGYGIHPVHGVDLLENARKAQRTALWRWLVAGFCMMQVMMYMWPLYDAAHNEMDATSDALMRWAMLLLSIPVLLFSSGPFFSSAWRDIQSRRVSMDLPVAIGIALTFIVSCVATFYPQGAWGNLLYFDSLTMFVFILLSGRWLEAHLRTKTAGALDGITHSASSRATRLLADGSSEKVAALQLRVHDTVRVRAGEQIPADGVILAGTSWVDEALLTGESKPLEKTVGSSVVAGSSNLAQQIDVRVSKTGDDTRLAQIVALMERAADAKPRMVQLADKLAQPFLVTVLLIAAAAFGWWWLHGNPQRGIVTAIDVLIVTCPCALALAAPAALLSATAALAKRGILLRDIGVLERLAQVRHALFDKTGTLTQDAITVARTSLHSSLGAEQVHALAAAMAAQSLHPAARAVATHAQQQLAAAAAAAQNVQTVSLTETAGMGVEGLLSVEGKAMRCRLGRAAWCGARPEQLDDDGMQVWLAQKMADGTYTPLATYHLSEGVRPDAAQSLAQLRALGLELSISTGDSASAASRVGTQLGFSASAIAATSTPQDKLARVHGLQAQGHKVLMVGDGVNDAPVLAGADVSVAMAGAAPLAQVKSDVVLLKNELATVPLAVAQARRAMQIVRQSLWWAVVYNLIALPLALGGYLTPWIAGLGMAISSLIVLLNAARLQKLPTMPTSA